MKRNMEKVIQEVKIREGFDMVGTEINQLKEWAEWDIYTALYDAFKYGYALGGRAEKVKAKK